MNVTYDGRKSSGLCVDCGLKKPREGRVRCVRCSDILSRREKERREARKKASLCIYCGKPVVGSMVTCASCRDRITASLSKRDRREIVAKSTKKLRDKRRDSHMCIHAVQNASNRPIKCAPGSITNGFWITDARGVGSS